VLDDGNHSLHVADANISVRGKQEPVHAGSGYPFLFRGKELSKYSPGDQDVAAADPPKVRAQQKTLVEKCLLICYNIN
jgi:hypothetical protein